MCTELATAPVLAPRTFRDSPWINGERSQPRLLEMDCLGEIVEDDFGGRIGSVLHREHVPEDSQYPRWRHDTRTIATH